MTHEKGFQGVSKLPPNRSLLYNSPAAACSPLGHLSSSIPCRELCSCPGIHPAVPSEMRARRTRARGWYGDWGGKGTRLIPLSSATLNSTQGTQAFAFEQATLRTRTLGSDTQALIEPTAVRRVDLEYDMPTGRARTAAGGRQVACLRR